MKISGINLSEKEYKVIEIIRKDGKWKPPHAQVPTVKNLIAKGICDWHPDYIHLVLTDLGKGLDL